MVTNKQWRCSNWSFFSCVYTKQMQMQYNIEHTTWHTYQLSKPENLKIEYNFLGSTQIAEIHYVSNRPFVLKTCRMLTPNKYSIAVLDRMRNYEITHSIRLWGVYVLLRSESQKSRFQLCETLFDEFMRSLQLHRSTLQIVAERFILWCVFVWVQCHFQTARVEFIANRQELDNSYCVYRKWEAWHNTWLADFTKEDATTWGLTSPKQMRTGHKVLVTWWCQ